LKFKPEIKVGLFALGVILLVAVVTLKIGDRNFMGGGGYDVEAYFQTVSGLNPKAPIEMSGVAVGVVRSIELQPTGLVKVVFTFNRGVVIAQDARAILKTRGFLGDTYVEIAPGDSRLGPLKDGDRFVNTETGGDLNVLMNRFNGIAQDVEVISEKMRGWTERNEDNMDRIAQNLAELTENLNRIIKQGGDDVQESMDRIASITRKIDEGRGTLGKLVNDKTTIDKLNTAVDNLNETLGGFNRMELELGYHGEYLSNSKDFKNYVSLGLRPAPDKAFLFDLVADPRPDTTRETKTSQITTGGTTSTVTTNTETLKQDGLLFSAQLAKSFYDLTVRGGIIESKGGMGVDYDMGPMTFSASAFDFETEYGEKPHLKFSGNLNVTENFYLMGGADDAINPAQKTDYFVGAGFRLVDEDVKSILKLGSLVK